jgi:hypothetical protein
VRQNPVLDDWVKQGINLIGSVESIQTNLLICPKTVETTKSRFFIISSTDNPC